ncbi:C13 family peptidase [Solidesulfovibrio sp.]|uniref:C13 family peptidase n=1 Tax=Solidesulfovibrio sp. TaxID=2910990 RepID=UPI0026227439|nr:C13 family peptidase [Solidesulfovibrio sp.]
MRFGRLLLATVLLAAALFLCPQARAADIDTYAKAYDRLLAQDARAGGDGASVSGDETLRQGSVGLTLDGRETVLGQGPGWVFGLALPLGGGKTIYRVALVVQDGTTVFRDVQSLPSGLTPVASKGETTAAAVDSQAAALAALTDRLLGHSLQGRRVYVANEAVADTAVVALWRGEVRLSDGPGWLFFVDDRPKANWEHPCRYVLVAKTGEITVAPATMPPKDLSPFTELTFWPTPGSISRAAALETSEATPTALAATDASHRYAVIISGGANPSNNHTRYWKDCSYFFKTLKANGFLQDNIYVLVSDGQDPAVDQSDNTSSVWDLNNDSIDDIRYSATKANITAVFNELAGKMTSQDILYLFTTDHGGNNSSTNPAPYSNTDVVLWLWNDTSITNAEFAAEMNKVTAKAIVGIFEQCYSGGFVEALKAPNRVLMSASRWWELSYAAASASLDYDEFSYYATQALADPTKGDSNGDGIVTMEEAFLYALAQDSYQAETLSGGDNDGEHPSYYSDPWDLGRKLALTGWHTEAKTPAYGGYAQYETRDAFPSGGTAQGWQGTDQSWALSLPFAFPWGGASYTTVNVGSNGMLSFGTAMTNGLNTVEGLKAAVALAPYWDRLTTTASGDDISVRQDADSVTVIWKAHTWIDDRPVNAAVRLSRNGTVRFHYGTGNRNTSRTTYRDKTIGVSLGDAANGKYLLAVRNGAADLGGAKALAIQPATMAPPNAAQPWISLLLQ